MQAVTVLIAALAFLGTAGYFAISSVVAQETRELRDQVLIMQHNVSKMQHDIRKILDQIGDQETEQKKQFEELLRAIREGRSRP